MEGNIRESMYLITTVPNLEDVAIKEVEEIGGEGRKIWNGKIIAEVKNKEKEILKLLSINHVAKIIKSFNFSSLEEIKRESKVELPIKGTFKVEVSKVNCKVHSIDIARIIGKNLEEVNKNLIADLKNPEHIVRVDVIKNLLILSVQLTKTPLYRRGYRKYKHPKSINPIIAHGMVKISSFSSNNSLLDPFCGVGTIPIEAYLVSKSNKIYGSDKNPNFIEKAKKNCSIANAKVEFFVSDVREVINKVKEVDFIITNPPYGKEWKERNLFTLYKDSFKVFKEIAKKIFVITIRERWVRKLCKEFNLKIFFYRHVMASTFWPAIFGIKNEKLLF